MKHYRNQPQAASHVYRSVLLKPRQQQQQQLSAGEQPSDAPAGADRTTGEVAAAVRDSKSEPPPTPTRLANRSTVGDDGSERGDIICFYNTGTGRSWVKSYWDSSL